MSYQEECQKEKIDSPKQTIIKPTLDEDRSFITLDKSKEKIGFVSDSQSFLDDIGKIDFGDDWNLGEGEFRWRGRSSITGNPNSVTINWTTREVTWFLAEFTNLNNDYWAHPYYGVELFNGSKSLGKICFDTIAIPDEDLGDEPTDRDRRFGPRKIAPDVNRISAWQGVYWSYYRDSNGDCTNHV